MFLKNVTSIGFQKILIEFYMNHRKSSIILLKKDCRDDQPLKGEIKYANYNKELDVKKF